MIGFHTEGSKVKIVADATYPLAGTRFEFSYEAGADWAARLLRGHFATELENELK